MYNTLKGTTFCTWRYVICYRSFTNVTLLVQSLWVADNVFFLMMCGWYDCWKYWNYAGADPGFQVRGGGALKKIAPNGGRRENFWGISCKKSRFHTKKHILSNIRGGGGARRVRPPPWIRPCYVLGNENMAVNSWYEWMNIKQLLCLHYLHWCVFSLIPMIWHHDEVVQQRRSRATSHHSFITTVWWYNILFQTGYFL